MSACPRCGAESEMELVYVGRLRDKHLKCGYCSSLVDVADEVTLRRFTKSAGRQVEVSITRRDLHGNEAGEAGPSRPVAEGTGVDIPIGPHTAENIAVELPPEVKRMLDQQGMSELVSDAIAKAGTSSVVIEKKTLSTNTHVPDAEGGVMSPAAPGWASHRPNERKPTSAGNSTQWVAHLLMGFGLVALIGLAVVGVLSLLK